MGISRKDADLLVWFFERGVTVFWRSTFGTMLERAYACAYDSEGRRVHSSDAWSAGATLRLRENRHESSYVPEETDLLRAAQVSRRLRIVSATDPAAERTLEAYYGRAGARWAQMDQGRIFSLYPLTSAGERFVRADILKRPERDLSAHDRILAEVQVQLVAPTDERRAILARIHTQAEKQLAHAWATWRAAEPRAATAGAA
jgi:hypothetical protein